ncbi:AbrB/MazE/SpoVT family DNA-binding domain-containing protein [Bacillus velezensis]|uniref:AbrB/MazE/SpoVT family DNA-binding domain-containing protein n=1 Tax=Bacillus velezensis TaxID=492670 RepID=UPI0008634675|nr:AbrB/MazE/SpoVT family DNA-binding domain-containing protein [Bacillus velezensis]AOU00811.1 AbrB/MazE/SpoVT family DNA-binding domain-containing protein [Bacillus velezensis]MEC2216338.1 AbrB/MazE/SpoVT family DNA-binding domain-containing protein [Bacillus velezensis]QKF33275.1 AbrB/MazE/SpoVT family DNA-binding domain-containing protein [Bacillus velezensis]UMU14610.1 AbrB/MazE/SpoVT family DNA-binding domain-containing protein [Bacillus velezensis]UTY67664.1 AbrB/MazE/SpoVT family DNA-b
MKSIGVVRKVDELGRIVMPIELRRALDIAIKDSIEFFVDGDKIVLKKYKPHGICLMTGEITSENQEYGNGKIILSPEGAKMLLEEIKEALKDRS